MTASTTSTTVVGSSNGDSSNPPSPVRAPIMAGSDGVPKILGQVILPPQATRDLETACFRLRQKIIMTTTAWNNALADIFSLGYTHKKVKKTSLATVVAGALAENSSTAGPSPLSRGASMPVTPNADKGYTAGDMTAFTTTGRTFDDDQQSQSQLLTPSAGGGSGLLPNLSADGAAVPQRSSSPAVLHDRLTVPNAIHSNDSSAPESARITRSASSNSLTAAVASGDRGSGRASPMPSVMNEKLGVSQVRL